MLIKKDKNNVIIIGGSNVDIKGRPKGILIPHTSNPGTIEMSVGGVARNIAENLGRLKINTILLTAIGEDEYGHMIKKRTEDSGVNMEHIICDSNYRSSIFMAMLNRKNDLVTAISDMAILDLITPEYIQSKEKLFEESSIAVLDVSIPRNTIECIIELCKKHSLTLCVEPVSVSKSEYVKDLLKDITIITPNKDEAEMLVDISIDDMEGVRQAGEILLNKGIKMAVITLGPEGVYVATANQKGFIPSVATVVVDAIGAGDALVGGVIYGLMKDQSDASAIASGVAAATITLTSREAVSSELSPTKLEQVYRELESRMLLRKTLV
ncbi:MAG TPA: carbohydrate kinase family protein [Candidatus Eremiobacteraeota bacterium]|nr:MAG: Pseudouridine kinase [bacterium ADurb.Bin363]HPZ09126.1 carbohydrate kinase family protein [Candidatus Eremiobacteraeota bacterium]